MVSPGTGMPADNDPNLYWNQEITMDRSVGANNTKATTQYTITNLKGERQTFVLTFEKANAALSKEEVKGKFQEQIAKIAVLSARYLSPATETKAISWNAQTGELKKFDSAGNERKSDNERKFTNAEDFEKKFEKQNKSVEDDIKGGADPAVPNAPERQKKLEDRKQRLELATALYTKCVINSNASSAPSAPRGAPTPVLPTNTFVMTNPSDASSVITATETEVPATPPRSASPAPAGTPSPAMQASSTSPPATSKSALEQPASESSPGASGPGQPERVSFPEPEDGSRLRTSSRERSSSRSSATAPSPQAAATSPTQPGRDSRFEAKEQIENYLRDIEKNHKKLKPTYTQKNGVVQTKDQLLRDGVLLPTNDLKCRFTLDCIQETAVKVPEGYDVKYLHANFVTLDHRALDPEDPGDVQITSYIAAQAPNSFTNQFFWLAALEHTELIIDLSTDMDYTKFQLEEQRTYYPTEEGEKKTFGDIEVTLTKKETEENGFTKHTYTVLNTTTEKTKEITRINFTAWPDHQALNDESAERLQVIMELHSRKRGETETPKPIVHCRGGVGRTGTYIVMSTLKELADQGKLNDSNLLEAVEALVLSGREQRGEVFVQNPSQLEMIIRYASKLIGIELTPPTTAIGANPI